MYCCEYCGAHFETPKTLYEKHGLDCPPYEEVPVCPYCGGSDLVCMVQCSCCGEYTAQCYVKTADGRIYCDNCFEMEDPEW